MVENFAGESFANFDNFGLFRNSLFSDYYFIKRFKIYVKLYGW